MITELIAELPSESAYLELLERFDKLLKKYSRKLSLEDSYEELRLFFFKIVNKMNRQNLCCHSDGQAVNYIALSIKNYYIALSAKNKREAHTCFSDMTDEQIAFVDSLPATNEQLKIKKNFPSIPPLTDKEINVLIMLFELGYSVHETADILNTSRQAVNQTKLRAINKIREALVC